MSKIDKIDVIDDRENKLPVWAREKLADARRRVKDAERQATEARLATAPDESRAVMYRYAEVPVGLGANPTVRFTLKPGGWDHSFRYVDVRINERGDGVEIMGGRSITVQPQTSNVVQIWVRED